MSRLPCSIKSDVKEEGIYLICLWNITFDNRKQIWFWFQFLKWSYTILYKFIQNSCYKEANFLLRLYFLYLVFQLLILIFRHSIISVFIALYKRACYLCTIYCSLKNVSKMFRIKISFSRHPNIYLLHYLFTFYNLTKLRNNSNCETDLFCIINARKN